MLTKLVQCRSSIIEILTVGQGPLIVILPSLGRGVEDMQDLARGIATEGYSVCLPNPRGIGKSMGPMCEVSLNDLADDIFDVIESLTPGSVCIAGHAFGNWVARNLATRYPQRISGVVLIAAAHNTIRPELARHIDRCLDIKLSDDVRLSSLQQAFFAPGHDARVWLAGWYSEVARMQRHASAVCPRQQWWHAGVAPILDLQAEQDPFAPSETAYALARELGLDRVKVVRVQDASHALIPEQPEIVVKEIVAFMNGIRQDHLY